MTRRLVRLFRKQVFACGAAVVVLSFLPYLQTRRFEFINYDDYSYVHNSPVAKGLSPENLNWALTDYNTMANWHPLTYLSLMTDVTLFGLNPGAMHAVNALLHALAAGMLFVLLAELLGIETEGMTQVTTSHHQTTSNRQHVTSNLMVAVLAALFWSLHPLRVESVAWISSRKDVLSVLFCLGGLLAHLADVRLWWKGVLTRESDWRKVLDGNDSCFVSWRWWLGFGCFILGCMAKPTMMVFPAFVALIEWLVAGRVRWKALSAYAAGATGILAVTVSAQGAGGAIIDDYPLLYRIMNAAVSISIYARQIFLPYGLTVFYPYEERLPIVAIVIGVLCVALFLALAAWCWKRLPVLTFGVIWFLAGLSPVLGLIQVGWASHADRYTYLPALGLSVMVALGFFGLLNRSQRVARSVTLAGAVAVVIMGGLTWRQVSWWRDNPTLFSHTLVTSKGNFIAHRNMGFYYYGEHHDCVRAVAHFDAAFRANRERNRSAQLTYIMALAESGAIERAKEETRELSEWKERFVLEAMNKGKRRGEGGKNLLCLDTFLAYAIIAYCEHDYELAEQHAEYVLRLRPENEDAHYVLGLISWDERRINKALEHWYNSLEGGPIRLRQFLKSRFKDKQK